MLKEAAFMALFIHPRPQWHNLSPDLKDNVAIQFNLGYHPNIPGSLLSWGILTFQEIQALVAYKLFLIATNC